MGKAQRLPKISAASSAPALPAAKLITAKTNKGKRYLEKRAPKAVEDTRRSLILYGNKISQVVKDVLTDIHKLKGMDSVKFTRKNEEIRPFDVGGESSLEFYTNRSNCSLFALGNHTKKRPHNLTLGRMYDFRFYDAIELGVDGYQSIKDFAKAASGSQAGNKPMIIFVGEKFESVPALKQLKSVLLDFFRGPQVDHINLSGLDRVMMATAVEDGKVLIRQYAVKLKKSGTKVPRMALMEMGPRMNLSVRRHREAPLDVQKEAMKQPQLYGKKVKNVSADMVKGKVGRIYMPSQNVDGMALAKYKGLKKSQRKETADAVAAGLPKPRHRKAKKAKTGEEGDDE